MDAGAPSQFHHNKQNLIETFRKEGSGSNFNKGGMSAYKGKIN
jgi:hypothetical protein